MKALTVRQPWAWCIADGHKRVENRTRRTHHRGPLAIHAGAAWDATGRRDPRVLEALRLDLVSQERRNGEMDAAYHAGRVRQIIVVVDVVDCHPASGRSCCAAWLDPDAARWADPAGFHWVLDRPRALPEPVPAVGRLGLWDTDLDDPAATP